MITSGTKYKLGDIVVIPFPFTDLSSIKQRPVLIISNDHYNSLTEDIIVCGITSNPKNTIYSIFLTNNDLTEGKIPVDSRIKIDKIFTLKQSLIKQKVGSVKENIVQSVQGQLSGLFQKY